MEARSGMSVQPGERERGRFDADPFPEPDQGLGSPVDLAPRPSFGSVLLRRWRVVVASISALVFLSLGYGLVRTPNYTAETHLAVGGLNASDPATNTNFFAAAQQLAETYSRAAQGDQVVGEVAKKLRARPVEVRSHLSATPIPQTPIFLLTATTDSGDSAIAMSRIASDALVREVNRASDADPGLLLRQYRQAEAQRARAARQLAAAAQGTGSRSLSRARTDLIAAEARADRLKRAYADSEAGGSVPLKVIQRADSASSDRASKLQLMLFVGVVGGFIIGSAIALFLESSRYPGFEQSTLGRWELARRSRAQRERARRART